jgi:hypothetical protein
LSSDMKYTTFCDGLRSVPSSTSATCAIASRSARPA